MRKLPPITPGKILLEEFLKPMGISQYRLAKEIAVPPQRIGEIIAGKRAVTADMDLRLCRFFGLSNGYWLRAQIAHDTEVAQDAGRHSRRSSRGAASTQRCAWRPDACAPALSCRTNLMPRRTHHRHHRPGRRLPRRVPARQGLHRPRHQAPDVAVQHRPDRSPLRGSARPRPPVHPALRRSHRLVEPRPRDAAGAARRGLQPRRAEPRRGVVRGARVHGQLRCDGHAAAAGGDPHPRARRQDALLPGVDLGDVRPGAGNAAEGDHALPSALAVRRGQALRATGSPSTTASRTGCTPATASCSTTSRRSAARPSSRARSPARSRASCSASQDCLYLGNLDARRDWGHARDYVRAMWLMLQQPAPEDFVIATGEQHSVRDFVDAAAAELGVALAWEGADADEVGASPASPQAAARSSPGPDDRPHRSPLLPPGRGGHAAGRCDQGADEARLDARDSASRSWSRKWCATISAARQRDALVRRARPRGARAQRWLSARPRRHRLAM